MALGCLIKAVSLEVCVWFRNVWDEGNRKILVVECKNGYWPDSATKRVFAYFNIWSVVAGWGGKFSRMQQLGEVHLPQALAVCGTAYGVQQRWTSGSDLRNKRFMPTHLLPGQMMPSFWGRKDKFLSREKERWLIFTSLNSRVLPQVTCLVFFDPIKNITNI